MALTDQKDASLPVCGIVMPISKIDGCEPSHWLEVKEILETAIQQSGFTPNLVSNADDVRTHLIPLL